MSREMRWHTHHTQQAHRKKYWLLLLLHTDNERWWQTTSYYAKKIVFFSFRNWMVVENEIHLAWSLYSYRKGRIHMYITEIKSNIERWLLTITQYFHLVKLKMKLKIYTTQIHTFQTRNTHTHTYCTLLYCNEYCMWFNKKKTCNINVCLSHKYINVYWPRIVCHWNIFPLWILSPSIIYFCFHFFALLFQCIKY